MKIEKDEIDEEIIGEWRFFRFEWWTVHFFLLGQARGNGAVMPNVAEKRVFEVPKTLKFNEIWVKNENIHETGRELSFLSFD